MASSTALKVDAKIKQLLMTGNIARAVRDGFAALLTRVQQLRAKRLNLHLKQQACVRAVISKSANGWIHAWIVTNSYSKIC